MDVVIGRIVAESSGTATSALTTSICTVKAVAMGLCGVEGQWAKTQVMFPETCVPPVLDGLDTEGTPGCSDIGKNKMAASNGGHKELWEQLRFLWCRGVGRGAVEPAGFTGAATLDCEL